jgi:drug/metabolite transporter (DMT)-like permease
MTAVASARDALRRREETLPVAAALLTVVLWASAFVGIRSAAGPLGPGPLALLRLLVGSTALSALLLIRREGLPDRRALRGIVICGVLWFGAYNIALNEAERRVDAGTAAMLVNVGPVLVALLAGFVLHEGFPGRLLGGCLVAFVGAIVIGLATSHHGVGASWGAVLCIVAACAYAIGVVAQKPALRYASALQATWLGCTIGAIVCLPFAPALVGKLGSAPASAIGWGVYLGIAPTAVGFATWAYVLARTEAGRLAAVTYLVPPLTILFSWWLLHQTPPALAVAGGALCLVGVAITRGRARRVTKRGPVA